MFVSVLAQMCVYRMSVIAFISSQISSQPPQNSPALLCVTLGSYLNGTTPHVEKLQRAFK